MMDEPASGRQERRALRLTRRGLAAGVFAGCEAGLSFKLEPPLGGGSGELYVQRLREGSERLYRALPSRRLMSMKVGMSTSCSWRGCSSVASNQRFRRVSNWFAPGAP